MALHKDFGRSGWFYAQQANLYRRGKSSGFSIPMPVTASNRRNRRRNWIIVVQGILPSRYEYDSREVRMTGAAGSGIYLDFWRTAGFSRLIDEHLRVHGPSRGWTDEMPHGVEMVFLRSDSAANVEGPLRYCAKGKNKRFGVIEFAIGVDMTQEFKKAVGEVPESQWFRLNRRVDGKLQETNQEYAEVRFVPDWMGQIRRDRYIGIWRFASL